MNIRLNRNQLVLFSKKRSFLSTLAIFVIGGLMLIASIQKKERQANTLTIPYELSQEGAWCWFADPRAIHYENEAGTINKTYIGYIDIHGNIKASQHDFKTGETQEVLVRSCFQPDDHNNPTFMVLPDKRVMIFYSRHTDEPCFYYRVSKKPGDITDLGYEFKIPTERNTTYPSPFILSDDPDSFYLCWRGISWHPTVAKLSLPDEDGKVEIVWGPKQIVQSTASRPYAKYASNGKDKIYLAYTTGHPDPTIPNYLYFNYIDVKSMELKDVTGKVISKIGEELHHVAATQEYENKYTNAVVDDTQQRDWLWQTAIAENGDPVVAMVTINEDKSLHDYYYVRWTGSKWQKTFLTHAGGHFHQSPDIEKCYSGGMGIDDQNPNEVYCSVPVPGIFGKVYELIKYTINEQGEISQTDTVTRDSEKNNVRPFIIPNRKGSPLKLVWMKGDYYDWIVSNERPLGFCTSIYTDYNLKGEAVDLNPGLVIDETALKDRTFELPQTDEFTVFLDLALDTVNYQGRLIQFDDLEYGLDAGSMKSYIKIVDGTYISNNILGNSDCWKQALRSTDGTWYDPVKYSSFCLTLVYSNGEVTTYINGLIDQIVPVSGSNLKRFVLGHLVQKLNRCKVYKRKLNFTEMASLSEN